MNGCKKIYFQKKKDLHTSVRNFRKCTNFKGAWHWVNLTVRIFGRMTNAQLRDWCLIIQLAKEKIPFFRKKNIRFSFSPCNFFTSCFATTLLKQLYKCLQRCVICNWMRNAEIGKCGGRKSQCNRERNVGKSLPWNQMGDGFVLGHRKVRSSSFGNPWRGREKLQIFTSKWLEMYWEERQLFSWIFNELVWITKILPLTHLTPTFSIFRSKPIQPTPFTSPTTPFTIPID